MFHTCFNSILSLAYCALHAEQDQLMCGTAAEPVIVLSDLLLNITDYLL